MNDILKIGLGFERLFFFLIIFLIMCHIMTCVWLISASFASETNEETSWLDDYAELSSNEKYLTSLYFAVTTITTVGYGDISGQNIIERIVSIILMLIGVLSFSFATGSLSSIMSNYDQANAKL